MSENNIDCIDIAKPIRFIGGNRPMDAYYGPYIDEEAAKKATDDTIDTNGNKTYIRYEGMTVGIIKNGKVVEYVFTAGENGYDLIKKVDTEKIKEDVSKLLPKYNAIDNKIEFPNLDTSVTSVPLLKEGDITKLSLDSFTNIKEQLFGKGVDVTTITAQVDKNSKLQGVLGRFDEHGILKPAYVGGLTAVQESANEAFNIATLADNKAKINEEAASAACGMVSDNPTPYATDGSLNDLITTIAKIEAVPEAAVLSSIRNTDTYRFVRIGKYNNIEAKNLTNNDIEDCVREIDKALKIDGINIDNYIYMVEDTHIIEKCKITTFDDNTIKVPKFENVNKQFTLYYVTSLNEVKQLQFKKTFDTQNDYNTFKGHEVVGTLDIGGKSVQYFRNDTDDSGLTESTLKVYSTTYKWSLLTNFYNVNGGVIAKIFTNDSTGDGIADLNEDICNVNKIDDGRNTPYYEYELKPEYQNENEKDSNSNPTPLYTTLKYLTNNGERNTKYIYLLCVKDGKFDGKDSEYGFYFRPYIWYNNSVQRLNSTITMGYSFTGKSWDYTDPISEYGGIKIESVEDIDNLLNVIETKENVKILVPGQPSVSELNDIDFESEQVSKVRVDDFDIVIKQTYEALKSVAKNKNINADYSITNNEFYQLSNYFYYSDYYNKLQINEQNFINLVDEIMLASKFYLNTDVTIVTALTATLMKMGIKNYQKESIVQDFKTYNLQSNVNGLPAKFKKLGIEDSFAWETLYPLVAYKIKTGITNDNSKSSIGTIILNMFKINSYLLERFNISSVVAYIIFANSVKVLDSTVNILYKMTNTTMCDDASHVIYKALAKLKLQNNISGFKFELSSLDRIGEGDYFMKSESLNKTYGEKYGNLFYSAYISDNPTNTINNIEGGDYSKYQLTKHYDIDGNFIVKVNIQRRDAKPEVKEIKETTYITTITPKGKNEGSPKLPDDWYKTNTVVVFLVDSETNGNSITNTFEYRKWNKCTKTWVDYGMEIITIKNGENNWKTWKPRPSLDLNLTNLRVSQRNILKNNQNQYQTRLAISTDVTNLTDVLTTANVSQANTNAVLVDMINTLTATINKMNDGVEGKALIKGLALNESGVVVKSEETKVMNFTTGNLEAPTSTNMTISSVTEATPTSTANISVDNLVSNKISTTPTTKITTVVKI